MDPERLPITITSTDDGQHVLRIDTDMASGVYVPGGGITVGLSDPAKALLLAKVLQACRLADQAEVITGLLRQASHRPEVQERLVSMLRKALDIAGSQPTAAA
jgi:hypothetical protein